MPIDESGRFPSWAKYPLEPLATTRGKFTTTLHLLTSAIKKLSMLQPAARVYFGKASGNLPTSLERANELGARIGVEYGFQSTTLDRNEAAKYGKDRQGRRGLSHIFAAYVRACLATITTKHTHERTHARTHTQYTRDPSVHPLRH